MTDDKKKTIFQKIGDSLSDKEEKEAAAKAQQTAAAAQAAASAAQHKASDAEKRASEAEAKAKELEGELKKKETEEIMRKYVRTDAAAVQASMKKFIGEHEVKGWDETLSHVALKFYGNATRPYWELIYEENKAVIGDNPNVIKPGMVLKIPELPADMKK